MPEGTVATILGLLALASVLWFPTLALTLGVLAVAIGFLGRRRLATDVGGDEGPIWAGVGALGIAFGAVAIFATIIVVLVTTDF